ncbi:hypothetical protein EDD22DRAFT_952265 [Suillus occidentalis]|nr:hypothetical protein EDD22DRAFT_952265 [Suillus occidentalis]
MGTHYNRDHPDGSSSLVNVDQADLGVDNAHNRPPSQSHSPRPMPTPKAEAPLPPHLESARGHPTIRQAVRLLLKSKAPPIRCIVLMCLELLPSHTNLHQDDNSAMKSALHNISFIIDPVYKLAICIDCKIAVPAKHVRGHAVLQHSFKAPPQHELDIILTSLGCINKFVRPSGIVAPIIGLRLLKGLQGTFLAKMGWHKAIEGGSVACLLQSVAAPGDEEDHLQALHTATHHWLTSICATLLHLDITFLRWMNTSKGEIVNAPFQAPVTDSYVSKCARL